MTPSDVSAALLLTEGLGACARIAVESRVSLRAYLAAAESSYRALATPAMGRPSPVDAWTPLVDAFGGVERLAEELGTTRRTLARWRAGSTSVPASRHGRIREMARRRKVQAPL